MVLEPEALSRSERHAQLHKQHTKGHWGVELGGDPRAVTAALKQLARRGVDLSEVLLSMQRTTIQANVYHYNTAISSCQGSSWQSALRLLSRMSACLVNADAVSQNAAMAAVGPVWERAVTLFCDSHKESVAFNSVLSAWGKAGKWELGHRALSQMQCLRVQPDHISFTSCLDASGRADCWRGSSFLLRQMSRQGVRADVVAWNCAISGQSWQPALEALASMPSQALAPDRVSYGSAISRCGQSTQWQHALATMRCMNSHACPHVSLVTYHAAISACEAQWPLAIGLLAALCGARLAEVVTYNSSASACQKALQWLQALETLQSMSGASLRSDCFSCSTALGACRDYWQLALMLVEGMGQKDLPPNAVALNALTSAVGQGGRWRLALGAVDGGDCFTYAAAISACEKAREWQSALSLLWQMQAASLPADAVCFTAAISACEKGLEWQHAICVLSAMQDCRVEASVMAYNAVVSALEKSSCWELALSSLSSLGPAADVVTFNAVARQHVADICFGGSRRFGLRGSFLQELRQKQKRAFATNVGGLGCLCERPSLALGSAALGYSLRDAEGCHGARRCKQLGRMLGCYVTPESSIESVF